MSPKSSRLNSRAEGYLRRDVRIDLIQAALARVETIARGVALNKLTMFAGQHLPLYK